MIRDTLCFLISKRLLKPPAATKTDDASYSEWRGEVLAEGWQHFDDAHVVGKDVLDFGSGKGNLTFHLATKAPRRIVGVELHGPSVAACRAQLERSPPAARVEFYEGTRGRIPLPDASFDTLLAFDVVEHVMEPDVIFQEWARVLRPGGRVLIEWCPYRNPWGPHMESMVPIPWAHVIFGERALFRTCERIYDDPNYVHRPWDFDPQGNLQPNKWREWSTFKEQGYINQLNVRPFRARVEQAGFQVARLEHHTFGSLPAKDVLGPALMKVPVLNELLCSYVIAELVLR